MRYRYHPPGEHHWCEFRPAKPAKSPPTPKFTPTGDSPSGTASDAATQTDSGEEVVASGELLTQAASSHEVAAPGDLRESPSGAASALPTAMPEASSDGKSDGGTAPQVALSVASAATDERDATHASRRPLSSDDVARALVYIECGYSLRAAAAEIGRHHSTLTKRLRSDRALTDALAAAREKARSAPLAQVREASRTSWRAAAWLVKYLDARERGGPPHQPKRHTAGS